MENKGSSHGIGFIGLLQIAFIILKLINVLSWSWIWILSPIWISALFVIGFIILFVILGGK